MNRRQFMGTAAGAAALSQSATGASFTVEDLDRAAARPVLQLPKISSPVILESVELRRIPKTDDYLLHIRSKDGAEGISIPNSRASYINPILQDRIVPFMIGKDVRNLENLEWELYRWGSNYKLQGLAFWCAHAWIEFAILDMLGRMTNKSITDLIGGGQRTKIPYYVASGRRDSTPEEEIDYLQQLLDESKAPAIKFRVGGRMSRNADALPGRTENLIRLAGKNFGGKIDIHADANSSYDPPQAIKVGRMLEAIDAVYFEEPCPFDHLEDTKKVTGTLDIPVAGGEQEFSDRRFRWMIANQGVDIVQPDLQYYGGLIRSMRVARMADVAGMPTTVHISGGFGFVYMLHFAAAVKDPGEYQEYKRGIEKYADWFEPALHYEDGAFVAIEGPGVGIRDIKQVLKGSEKVT
jgi:L-alanine-DL-glutamate epimerase-like enolase superfamily enzyme